MYCGVSMYSVSPNWIYRYTCTCVCISVYVYVYICVRVNILWRRPCFLYRQIESMVIHVYVYVYTCVCVCTCIEEKPMYSVTANWIYEDKWECICIYIYIYTYMYTYMYVYIYIYMYICVCEYKDIYMHLCKYIVEAPMCFISPNWIYKWIFHVRTYMYMYEIWIYAHRVEETCVHVEETYTYVKRPVFICIHVYAGL